MSDTQASLRWPSWRAGGRPVRPPAELALLLAACALGLLLNPGTETPDLALRAREPTGLAVGTDGTLILAGLLGALGLPPLAALWGASWSALPLLAALPFRAPTPRLHAVAVSVGLVCSPLTLLACASGYGWAAVGLYALWSAVLGLPNRTPHQGLTRLGLGVLAAFVFCPAPWTLALPVFAVLFAAAPQALQGRHMSAVYLLAFAPCAGWTLTLLYAQWRSGAVGAGPPPGADLTGLPLAVAAALAAGLALACAPGLLRRGAPLAVLAACALFATGSGVPLTLALLAAATAQGAQAARGGSLGLLALGLLGALIALAV